VPPEPDIAGYRVYAGATSRVYGPTLDAGLPATVTLNRVVYYIYHDVNLGSPTYLTVTDYNQAQVESSYSNEGIDYASVSVPRVDAGPDQTGNVGDADLDSNRHRDLDIHGDGDSDMDVYADRDVPADVDRFVRRGPLL
jgi:hypothetical protein